MYYIYHIPGEKIGVTSNPKIRVEKIQGYKPNEYEILLETKSIDEASEKEILLQKEYNYKVDTTLYKNLKFNRMKLNITDQTTTFPVDRKQLKNYLNENIGFSWQTKYGKVLLDDDTTTWIVKNSHTSQYSKDRTYVYNKTLYEWFCSNNSLESLNVNAEKMVVPTSDLFPLIRQWARDRGIYDKGDSKTQYVKLMEEAGELAKAILNRDEEEIKDAIGDMVVVLTNLAVLENMSIEDCIRSAYSVISQRKGKMVNGTFVKQTL